MRPAPQFRPALFELLADAEPRQPLEAEPRLRVSRGQLQESVRSELERLLSSRRAARPYLNEPSVIDYGVADWSALHPARAEDRQRLAREIRLAIRAYEPRLASPAVSVDLADRPHALRVRIEGLLNADGQRWPAAFVAELSPSGARLAACEEVD
ncbi:type VI secretion system baseplate subunit TssE [Chromobacterium phragmitis]|uniref:type VI secretion system baseplate subunit TssE n=1 Tax=Chromobacterium amazonense TaxID=1382803 RepID=UPI0021B78650|nr:type VI secretion system baseplate subunit TssE [Chromobacterium amazonense]MBM2886772.1 type VI secretion system baseplate subunit TssE [Chromobacterium amazonense]MDE1715847.1 type VI secretion system baseplate subunit TssE [Chromobacterium amazonense]